MPSIVALGLGLFVGIVANQTQWPLLLVFQDVLQPIGQLWLRALQMTIFPLVVVNMIVAILRTSGTASFGRLTVTTLLMFVLFLVAVSTFSITVGSVVVGLVPVDPNAGQALASISDQAAALAGRASQQTSLGQWLTSLIPTNPFNALSEGHLLPVLIFTALFAMALTKASAENREVAERFFQGACEAMFVLVGWILAWTPIGVFALTAVVATGLGTGAITILVQYLVLLAGFISGTTLLLYPVTSALGGVSMGRFGQGVLPAQIVAASTRSSLASLPALLDGARTRLGLAPGVANLTLPLCASVFKVNRAVTPVMKVLIITHLFSIDVSLGQLVTFVATVIIMSFSTVGIPMGGGTMKTLPAYLAAGVPLEAYVLTRAVESFADIFMTLLNVTGHMSVTVILNRLFGRSFERGVEVMPDTLNELTGDRAHTVQDERKA